MPDLVNGLDPRFWLQVAEPDVALADLGVLNALERLAEIAAAKTNADDINPFIFT